MVTTRPPNPSPQQAAIFRFALEGAGHGVVQATAGSGKTTTLVELANRLPRGRRACFLAFNVHTARELQRRLPAHVEASTVHALGHAVLRRLVGGELKVDNQKYRRLAELHLGRDARTWRLTPTTRRAAATYLGTLATLVRLELTAPAELRELTGRYGLHAPEPGLVAPLEDLLWRVLDAGAAQAEAGLVDYADMLFMPVMRALGPASPFDFVMVDEAQDLSRAQLAFVRSCVAKAGRLLFVGDPHQALYGFAGADVNAMVRIAEATAATVLPLSVTYRCPAAHVRLARRFAPEIRAAPGAAEGSIRRVSETVLGAHVQPGDLVLCRVNAPLVGAALHLIQQGVPARVEGRDLAGRLVADAKAAFGTTLADWRTRFGRYEKREVAKILAGRTAAETVDRLLARREDELDSLRAVVDAATRAGIADTAGLVARVETLFRDRDHSVTFSTVHKAKGKEAERVFVLYPHLMPLPRTETPEEHLAEACVQFVALTRARRELVFVEADPAPSGPNWWRHALTENVSRPAPGTLRLPR